ncbi:MAG: glycosyltransferase family 2 protein [Micropepsaceae bacterium]
MTGAYSVVIPAWNAAATLGAAIRSVLEQTAAPAAIFVVDDGSQDETRAIASSFGAAVTLIAQANAGPGAAMSNGLGRVATPLAATLDADDLWLPHKAARQIALMDDPLVDAAFGQVRLFADDEGDPRGGRVMPGWLRTTMMIRTGLFHETGPVEDPPGRRGEMVDWLKRAQERGARMVHEDEVVALRRIRAGSLSSGRDPERDKGYLHAARAALLRRRAGGGGAA